MFFHNFFIFFVTCYPWGGYISEHQRNTTRKKYLHN